MDRVTLSVLRPPVGAVMVRRALKPHTLTEDDRRHERARLLAELDGQTRPWRVERSAVEGRPAAHGSNGGARGSAT